MQIWDKVYLATFLALPFAMAFLSPARRFLTLWLLIFLVPREFNTRWGPLSFCLTDAVFLGLIVPEAVFFLQEGWKKSRLSRDSWFAWAALGLLVIGTLYHLAVGKMPNPRFFLKDILPLASFVLLLLALRRSRLTWKPGYVWSAVICMFLMGTTTLLIAYIPEWRNCYREMVMQFNDIGVNLGYFLPAVAKHLSEMGANDPLTVRITDFIGGVSIGLVFLFFFPILIGMSCPGRLGWKMGLPLLAFLFYAILFLQSRTIFTSVFLGCFASFFLFPKEARRMSALALVLFGILSLITPAGQKNWARYGQLKNKELMETLNVQAPSKSPRTAEGTEQKKLEIGQPITVQVGPGDPPSAEKAQKGSRRAIYDTRFPIWQKALSAIQEHPLAGSGPGSVLVFPYGREERQSVFVDSLYITMALKWGLGALFFGGAWVVHLMRRWWRVWPALKERVGFEGAVLRGFPPALLSFLFLSFFFYPLMNISFSMFLASYLGLSLNTLEILESQEAKG